MQANQWQRGILIGILILIGLWLVSLIWGLAGKMHIAVSQANDAQWQYQSLETRKAALTANLAALATSRGQDAAVRTAFGVARPGEEVIVVVPPTTTTAAVPLTWWQDVLHWF
jgi:cell division protein FtsB